MSEKRSFILRSKSVACNLFAYVLGLFGENDDPAVVMEVIIRPYKADRTLAQNALLHVWCKEIADDQGMLPEEAKRFCKLRYGIPLLLADPAFERFARTYYAAIEPLPYDQQLAAMEFINVTSLMDTATFAHCLTDMQKDWANHGLVLSRTPRIYDEAFGVKQ